MKVYELILRLKNEDPKRNAFTLIELLVVIGIISILIAMLLPAVFRTLNKTDETRNRNDIQQLSNAIQAFESKYQVEYIPSRILISRNIADYQVNGLLEWDSLAYLTRVWPRLNWTDYGDVQHPRHPIKETGWGIGVKDKVILEGDQCLVFFLGGIPVNGGATGFANDPYNPARTDPDLSRTRLYDFETSRLQECHNGSGFRSYKDAYGKKPFVYFSSYKQMNGYNRYLPILGDSDCRLFGIWPYAETWDSVHNKPLLYVNPNTFQIISAGIDGLYGTGTTEPGSVYTPGITSMRDDNEGYDNQANFYDRFLGIPRF